MVRTMVLTAYKVLKIIEDGEGISTKFGFPSTPVREGSDSEQFG